MAASLLAEYDFDNLDTVVPVVVIKALCIATQERYNIGVAGKAGTFQTSNGNNLYSNIFPYKSNTGVKWTLNSNDPLGDFTFEVSEMIRRSLSKYANIIQWNDADTNHSTMAGSNQAFLFSAAASDPVTYDNIFFEVSGYTSYPDLSVFAPAEVKKWYDMITLLKYVARFTGVSNDDYKIYEGEFDQESGLPFFTTDRDFGKGGDWYGMDATSSTLTAVTSTTQFDDWRAANNSLFSTFSQTYDESVDTAGTYPPSSWAETYITKLRRDATTGDYLCFNRSFQLTCVGDWTDFKSALGVTGRPLSYKYQQAVTTSESFPTGQDTDMGFPYSTTGNNQRYYCDLTVTAVGDKDEILIDYGITPATLPVNVTDIAAGEIIQASVSIDSGANFLEFWDGDGGFDYYTP